MGVWARVGINCNGRTLLFAFAIVKDESEESMTFVHINFLKGMDNKKPDIIFIDEC